MKTITCIATGPSLTQEQVNKAYEISDQVIAVNDAYRLVPQEGKGSILYAADPRWWVYHWPHIQENWVGECHTQRVNWTPSELEQIGPNKVWDIDVFGKGLCRQADKLHSGGNSGFQAINIAAHSDCDRILLLGYDMSSTGKAHFFGDHPKGWANGGLGRFVVRFRGIKDDRIVNCTPGSALSWFPMADITEL